MHALSRRAAVRTSFLTLAMLALPFAGGVRGEDEKKTAPEKGQRVFTCGHSFHVFVPGILADMAKGAGIKGHTMAGLSAIGGSRVIQHWDDRLIARWGDEVRVLGTVDPRTKAARVLLLGKDGRTPAPIEADKVVLSLKEPAFQVDLKPRPQPKDPKGTASVFVGTHAELGKVKELSGTLSAEFDGKSHSGDIKKVNESKEALRKGEVDVLTLSPIYPPDDGIDRFVALALKHNPKVRVTIQENWLPFDLYDTTFTQRPKKVDHDKPTEAELKKLHEPYFKSLDKVVRDLNKKHDREAVFVVPVGQAVVALRGKILDGKAPGLKKQSDLFGDAIGHATPPLQALVAYCHFAVVYRRTPVGLPMPFVLSRAKNAAWDEKLNRLLQEIAWEAVTSHPLSGVKAEPKRDKEK